MGQAPRGESYNEDGRGLPLIAGPGDFNGPRPRVKKFTTAPTKRCRPGDVVLGIRASIGERVWADKEYCLGRGVAGLRPSARVDSRYLWHWLGANSGTLAAKGKGATFQQVNRKDISELTMSLPLIEEQRRIAAILDQADALRAKRREALAHLDDLTKSIFIDMFGRPDKCWPLVRLGDIADVKGGKRLPKGEAYAAGRTSHPYIRVTDLGKGTIDESNLVFLTPTTQSKISRYTVDADDVIISIAGSIGQVAVVPESLHGANLTENAAKIVRLPASAYMGSWLADALRMPNLQAQISSHVGQVTIGKLALFRIEKLHLPMPPMPVQALYVRRTEALRRSYTSMLSSQAESQSLFASLQDRAFSGRL